MQRQNTMQLEEILQSFVSLTDDAVAIGYRSARGEAARIVWMNEAFQKAFGYAHDEAIGLTTDVFICPDHFATFLEKVRPKIEARAGGFIEETLCRRKDGTTFWTSLAVSFLPEDDQGRRYSFGVYRDLSELKARELAAERALAEHEILNGELTRAQDRLISAIKTIQDPFAIFDAENRLVLWNNAYAKAFCDNVEELRVGMRIDDMLMLSIRNGRFPTALGKEEDWIAERKAEWIDGRGTVHMEIGDDLHYRVHRSVAPNGDTVVLRVDITEVVRKERELQSYAARLEEANREISKLVLLDELTGLGNRRFLESEFLRLRSLRREKGGEIAVLHVDLDRFKQINDTMGHAAGDMVLCEVAQRLKDAVGAENKVSRIGGDEFLVLIYQDRESDLPERLAERLVGMLAKPVIIEGKPCRFGASIGVARTPLAREEDLLTNSDIALYKAKHSGRAQVGIFDHSDLQEMIEAKRLADDIMRGIERSEFIPVYQPQVDTRTGKVVCLETLARWQHPGRGLLSPAEFIGAADEIGVLADIDQMVFDKALSECSTAFSGHIDAPSLAFNVSSKRILLESFLKSVEQARTYPGGIVFELLESIFLEEESDAFFFQIDAIREAGVGLELDDFGSGRASLIALQRVSPDRIKIDRRLVRPVCDTASARQLVASIVAIGKAMGIEVTAEGVETAEHARLLKDAGCTRLQGFHIARPAPLESLWNLLATPTQTRRVLS